MRMLTPQHMVWKSRGRKLVDCRRQRSEARYSGLEASAEESDAPVGVSCSLIRNPLFVVSNGTTGTPFKSAE